MRDIRKRDTITNEYIDVIINHKLYQLCNDCYHALGWTTISSSFGIASVKLRLERNKKIRNRGELCKLQRECEDALMELERLVKEKNAKTKKMAWIAGIIGSIFIIIAIIANLSHLIVSTILIALGFTVLVVACFILYKQVRKMKEIHLTEINQYYDVIYHLCKKAEQLIK